MEKVKLCYKKFQKIPYSVVNCSFALQVLVVKFPEVGIILVFLYPGQVLLARGSDLII